MSCVLFRDGSGGGGRTAPKKHVPEGASGSSHLHRGGDGAAVAKIPAPQGATVSEQVLVQSTAEKDRVSEDARPAGELEAGPNTPTAAPTVPELRAQ